MIHVLDASALLVVFHREAGTHLVEPLLHGAFVSAVNWSEVVQKAASRGIAVTDLRNDVMALGVTIVPFDAEQAERAAALWPVTKDAGLSLGDRACLALGEELGATVVTSDRMWSNISTAVTVLVVR